MSKRKTAFVPFLIATASFANGAQFQIDQANERGACRITDMRSGDTSYARSVANAWKSVRYQAQVRPDTENTSGWKGPHDTGEE
jgi:hypothetical protein